MNFIGTFLYFLFHKAVVIAVKIKKPVPFNFKAAFGIALRIKFDNFNFISCDVSNERNEVFF